MRKLFLWGAFLSASLMFAANIHAQDAQAYPGKPVRFIVPVPPGGGVDALARMVAEGLRNKWGQSVLVENRGGAGGNIGAEAVYKAVPDGHTLLFTAGGVLVTNKMLYATLNYEPELFVPISVVAANYSVLIVHPKVAADSVQKLIAFAKANPDRLDYASPGSGTGSHLTAELFKAMAGIKIAHIPYKGTGPALADIVGGQVASMFGELGSVLPHIRAGRLRALAVTSDKRNPALPEVPAMNEVLPGFLATPWNGTVAPPKTPVAIANKISAAIAEVLRQPDTIKRLTERNFQPIGGSPEEMALFMRQEVERWGKVVRVIGAKAD